MKQPLSRAHRGRRIFAIALLVTLTSFILVSYPGKAENKPEPSASGNAASADGGAADESGSPAARDSSSGHSSGSQTPDSLPEAGAGPQAAQDGTKPAAAGAGDNGAAKATATPATGKTAASETGTAGAKTEPKNSYATLFPADSQFIPAAENDKLQLLVHRDTGHFIVKDKRNGSVWRSFPDAEGWNDRENTDMWKKHMQSPVFIRYVEFNVRKDQIKETNLIDQKGVIEQFQLTDDGFRLTFSMPKIGFIVPVQVALRDDYVETRVLEEGFKDGKTAEEMKQFEADNKKKKDNDARMTGLRLYPFLGAYTSERENGYLLIPDGPGTLVQFQKDRPPNNNFYFERSYGEDLAFSNNNNSFSTRQPIRMPVFGIKSGEQSLLAVLQDGAEYGNVLAAPSKSMNQYNWATAEFTYRQRFFQPTDKRKLNGFQTFSKDRTEGDRSVRYYFLDGAKTDYVGMAERYRRYLMEEIGMQPLTAEDHNIPLQVNMLGADSRKGFLWDTYEPLTTTAQAEEIVNELTSVGVKRMSITYQGWQRGGFSEYGGRFPVDSRLGGMDGMRHLAEFAHAKGHRVMLDATSYTFNNNGRDGFRGTRDGLQDLGSVVIKYSERNGAVQTLVSPRFLEKTLLADLEKAKQLGVDGLSYGGGLGELLNSDFNTRYAATREESRQVQENLFAKTKELIGAADVTNGNDYTWKYVDHVNGLPIENSFDLFVDETVPFAQIALHGLVTYSSWYANVADNYGTYLLKNIEYGSIPAFMLTYAPSEELMGTRSLYAFYSTCYKDWAEEIAKQYSRFNEALGDVQDQFIVGHRALAKGVAETEYASGKRIVVNYNDVPYDRDGIRVGAKDFAVVPGRG
ncbi:DUF5696 domain-containing protein [Paenibacillus thiaminolyticus]|uniref:DUF5696 domain-containing protein n=1 Tax=Paenibacillus thiaminolyticus TaxID=49283 RepID=A0AAP9J0K1_PANTH|nr:DUF5696 domain-containing protein [Paenibacillus thiaminolyticus]MCY9535709.1 DUF5696 domain-containing protein [Paenibacillus thiaminolyticus]MCY9601099.1 DUF5696 domain-containing protein [Paenibacillus thiaminolyticus]MCY9609544.1 DUF5696 domain-containing protein [Paenibacillus thiaminolyticus]MCY9613182.1 DUF5696 domain-containing protein [Paenibacillus thiaminolyticus]MCY9617597.1 DUF5696 domain-containing protein [Paenibacillus thiaminolyticus]